MDPPQTDPCPESGLAPLPCTGEGEWRSATAGGGEDRHETESQADTAGWERRGRNRRREGEEGVPGRAKKDAAESRGAVGCVGNGRGNGLGGATRLVMRRWGWLR